MCKYKNGTLLKTVAELAINIIKYAVSGFPMRSRNIK